MQIKMKLLLAFLTISYLANAQNSVNSSGGDATSADGAAAYSIGQVFYENNSDGNYSISEGVQQAYKIEVVSVSELAKALSIELFPNPTTDKVILESNGAENPDLQFQLMDLNGRVLKQNNIQKNQESIGLEEFSSAVYLLHVFDGASILKTFKIIKK